MPMHRSRRRWLLMRPFTSFRAMGTASWTGSRTKEGTLINGERTVRKVVPKARACYAVLLVGALAACVGSRPGPEPAQVSLSRNDTTAIYAAGARALQDSSSARAWVLGRTDVGHGRFVPSDSVVAALIARGAFAGACNIEPAFLNCPDDRPQIRFGRMEQIGNDTLLLHASRYVGGHPGENGAEIILFDVELRRVGGGTWSVIATHYAGAT